MLVGLVELPIGSWEERCQGTEGRTGL